MKTVALPAPESKAQTLPRLLGLSSAGPLPLVEAVYRGRSRTALARAAHSLAPTDGALVYRVVSRPRLMRRRRARASAKGALTAASALDRNHHSGGGIF